MALIVSKKLSEPYLLVDYLSIDAKSYFRLHSQITYNS